MKNKSEFEQVVMSARTAGALKRARAIRLYCLDCLGYSSYEVKRCPSKLCPLWEFRLRKYTPIEKEE